MNPCCSATKPPANTMSNDTAVTNVLKTSERREQEMNPNRSNIKKHKSDQMKIVQFSGDKTKKLLDEVLP